MSTAAARSHRRRQRRELGLRCYRVQLPEVEVEELLIAGGLLSEKNRDDLAKVEAAIEVQIQQLIHISVTRDAVEFFERLRSRSKIENGDAL